jgi:Kef-type K+ transport system membrane component KefB
MGSLNMGVLFILGLGLFGGLLGAWFFQKIHVPQVIGYIVIGVLIGEGGFKIVSHADIIALQPFNLFALGIIGFLVGSELRIDIFRKYAKQFLAILLGEGIGAFLFVGIPSTVLVYFICHNMPTSVAAGVVFGAIASATDPASTLDVLWEYRARGVLTTSITAIVALDDALAMTLYGLGTSAAEMLTSANGSLIKALGRISLELFGAVAIGIVAAVILVFLFKWLKDNDRSVAFAIGLILLLISVSAHMGMDVILAAMTLGFVMTNVLPRRSQEVVKIMRAFSIPIYVLFFVLVGARLGLASMTGWLWVIVGVYVFGRTSGKMIGAYIGARATNSEPKVRKYLGLGLFAQGGVAIGLSIMASHHLQGIMITDTMALGDMIIFVVTTTTLIVQLAGPPMVKLAVILGKEAYRNVTADDVVSSWKVSNVMDKDFVVIRDNMPLTRAMQIFTENDYVAYPVIDKKEQVIGILGVEGLKQVLVDQDTWQWLLASDVMQPVEAKTFGGAELREVLDNMRALRIPEMPVVKGDSDHSVVGMLDLNDADKRIEVEVLRRQQPAVSAVPAV